MNPEEALHICRLAKAASPAQAVDEYTPELWALVLAPFRYVDAKEALTQLAGDQEWIHVSHLKKRVKSIRHGRIMGFGALPDPPAYIDPDDTKAMLEWEVQTREDIADGTLTTDNPQLPPGPRGPWDEEQKRAVDSARVDAIRAEIAKRAPTPERPPLAELAASAVAADNKRAEAAERIRADVRAACAPREESTDV